MQSPCRVKCGGALSCCNISVRFTSLGTSYQGVTEVYTCAVTLVCSSCGYCCLCQQHRGRVVTMWRESAPPCSTIKSGGSKITRNNKKKSTPAMVGRRSCAYARAPALSLSLHNSSRCSCALLLGIIFGVAHGLLKGDRAEQPAMPSRPSTASAPVGEYLTILERQTRIVGEGLGCGGG